MWFIASWSQYETLCDFRNKEANQWSFRMICKHFFQLFTFSSVVTALALSGTLILVDYIAFSR